MSLSVTSVFVLPWNVRRQIEIHLRGWKWQQFKAAQQVCENLYPNPVPFEIAIRHDPLWRERMWSIQCARDSRTGEGRGHLVWKLVNVLFEWAVFSTVFYAMPSALLLVMFIGAALHALAWLKRHELNIRFWLAYRHRHGSGK